MRFLALLALTSTVLATPDLDKRHTTIWNTNSIYSVLATALPTSLLAEATNTAKLSSDLAAAFSSATPAWFSSLPADVKSWIVIQGEAGAAAASTGVAGASGGHGGSMRNSSGVASPTLTATMTTTTVGSSAGSEGSVGSSASVATSASSVGSTGGAALPTRVVGGSVVALVGLVGALVV